MPKYCFICEGGDEEDIREDGVCIDCWKDALKVLELTEGRCVRCNRPGVLLHNFCFDCLKVARDTILLQSYTGLEG